MSSEVVPSSDTDASASNDAPGKSASTPPPQTAPSEAASGVNSTNKNNAASDHQQISQPPPPTSRHAPMYHHPYPPPPHPGPYAGSPYGAVVGNPASHPYHSHHRPPPPSSHPQPAGSQGHQPHPPLSPRHSYDRDDQAAYHHTSHRYPGEADYRGLPPPCPSGAYGSPPPSHYGPPPDDRRWLAPEGAPPPPNHHQHPVAAPPHQHHYPGYDGHGQHYGKTHPHPGQSYRPPPGHMAYHYPHPLYPTSNPLDEKSRIHTLIPQQQPAASQAPSQQQAHTQQCARNSSETVTTNMDGRPEGATSPSQILMSHKDEVTNMGCTCKKTMCLKLYCQCFAIKLYCGANCRCLGCYNTTKQEKARKNAMRTILSRNPTAFDTKFSKSKERKTKEQQAVLAHKLGCKCRKSACMKKYCECYAGSVKCSQNCRCIGCRNLPTTGSGPANPGDSAVASRGSGDMGVYEISSSHTGRGGREVWMMNAAHNLAFLKHGSPSAEKRTATVHDVGDVASMPSLAASSSDTSPEERQEENLPKKGDANGRKNGSSDSDALLLAAVAMTDFAKGNKGCPGDSNTVDSVAQNIDRLPVSAPVVSATVGARKALRPSPKRKSSDRSEMEDTEHVVEKFIESHAASDQQNQSTIEIGFETSTQTPNSQFDDFGNSPLDPREMKRTRLGSVRKKMIWESGDSGLEASPEVSTKENDVTVHETPDQKAAGIDKLTPVSARCIDFRRMNVNENKEA